MSRSARTHSIVITAASIATLAAVGCRHDDEARPDPANPVQRMLRVVPTSPELGIRALSHAAALTALGPRHTGSRGWSKALDYISTQFRDLGIEVRRDTWTDRVERLTFTNIIATLPGLYADKIILGCHHDTKCTQGHDKAAHNYEFVGANDSGSGVGLLLALAEELRDRPRAATYEFVFFDGEESVPYDWDITRALFGSRRYVRRYQQKRIDDPTEPSVVALVLLDMVGAADLQIDRETESTEALQQVIERAAQSCGVTDTFFANSLLVTDDHVPFLRAKIPAIDLIDIVDNPEWHTPADTIESLAADSFQTVGSVVMTALPEIERLYLVRPGVPTRPRR